MLLWSRLNSIAAALFLLCCSLQLSLGQALSTRAPASKKLILKFKADASPSDRERALRNSASSREIGRVLARQNVRAESDESTHVLTLRPEVPLSSEIARLSENPAVEFVEPNYRLKILTNADPVIPNDFDFSKMYALLNPGGADSKTNADIHATEAWRYATGDKRIIVAVIDTGIDYLHEDLKDNIWVNAGEIPFNGIDDDGNGLVDDYFGYDFVSDDSDPYDDNEHGTHVAGIIGARGNNEKGIAGVCWDVSLMAIKAFDDQGNGTVEAAIAGIAYAVANGARIINASWGLDEKSRALEDAVQKASDAGVLFVAAAGNNRSDAPSYPASFDSVLSVGATDRNDARAIFSNYGPTVDIAAPGDGIYSTLPENSYGYLSGTSMAAPHVSGTAALVLSRFPNYSRQELFDILINSVDRVVFDQPMGNGRLDASRAVQMDQPLPTARLSAPATLSGQIALTGTATGSFVAGYGVFVGAGKSPTNWIQIGGSTQHVTNDVLATVDSSVVPDGPAVVQLVVTNQNGTTAVVSNPVKVLNSMISHPLSADILAPRIYEITGTLYGPNKQFELFYGSGLSPASWTQLPSVPAGSILESKLGEWDTTQLPNGFYSLRMVTQNGTNQTEFLAPAIYVDGHLRDHWPVNLDIDADFPAAEWRNIRMADLDGDGQAELVVVDPGTRNRQQILKVFALDGTLRWSKELGFDIPPDVPAIGDIDGDGKPEIFVDVPDGIAAFHYDGSPVNGWPIPKSTRNHAKVLADLNQDGAVELITYSQEYSATQVPDLRELAVYTAKGQLVRKWDLPWCGSTNDVQKIFPAVANIDDDPELEIVAVSGCSEISAFSTRLPDPKWRATGDGNFLSSPVIGDVDGDGHPDIVVAAAADNDSTTGGVYIFQGDGQRWRGWPVLEEYSFFSTPALGDLDHDGRLEIVLASGAPSGLHVLQFDGFEADGWPIDAFHNGSSRVGVTLADLDGDGTSEILTGVPGFTSLAVSLNDTTLIGGVFAWDFHGNIVPFNGSNAVQCLPIESYSPFRTHKASPPLVGDFDGDGHLDLAISSLQERTFGTNLKLKNQSSIYSWKLGGTNGPRTLEWPMFAHDLQNRGAYTLPAQPSPQPTNVAVAIRDRLLIAEDHELQIQPLKNDYGLPPLQLIGFTLPSHGTLTQTNADTLSYLPDKNFSGPDSFTYQMRDATGKESTGNVLIRVKAVNDPPVAKDMKLSMKKNSSLSIFYSASDPENDPLTFRVLDSPGNGELWSYPGLGVYYPKRGFSGFDSFHYVANDGKLDSDPALVTIEIINSNNPPTAVSQTFLTKTNRAVHVQPSGDDLDGDPITFELVTGPTHGTVLEESSDFLYTPNTNYLGSDSFSVRPFDGTAYGDPAIMTINVIATNATPKAPDGSIVVLPNTATSLRLPGFDPDGDKISFTIVNPPLHGTLTGDPPNVTYLPATNYVGPDKFTYTVSDGFAKTDPATYSIQVVRHNQPPKAQDQTVATTTGVPVLIGLKITDPDGDPIRTVLLKGPGKGLIYGQGTNFTYVPKPGALGSDAFTYKGWDGQKFGNIAHVTVLISLPQNELPPTFNSIVLNDHLLEIVLGTPNTQPFFIEASTNLVDWSTASGPIVSTGSQFNYRETNSAPAARFYRARRQ